MVKFESLGAMTTRENKELVVSRCELTNKIVIGQKSTYYNEDKKVEIFAKNAIQLTDEQFVEFVALLNGICEKVQNKV